MELHEYLERDPQLKKLYEKVKAYMFSSSRPGYDWDHVISVVNNAILIGEAEGANMRIVIAAALLHDIGKPFEEGYKMHNAIGADMAPAFLKEAGFTDDEIKKVQGCILRHSLLVGQDPLSLEEKVLFDANVLESFGAYGLARLFFMSREPNFRKAVDFVVMRIMRALEKGPFYTETARRLWMDQVDFTIQALQEIQRRLKEIEEGGV